MYIKPNSQASKLSSYRQFMEMIYLYMVKRISPKYYAMAGFDHRSVPWKDKIRHLSSKAYYRRVWELNSYDYRKLSQNKLSEKAMFMMLGVPTPGFLGYLSPPNGVSFQKTPLRTSGELESFLECLKGERICFKMIEGYGGAGFVAVEVLGGEGGILLRPLDVKDTCSVEDFCANVISYSSGTPYLIEQYFEQHSLLSGFNPSSLNTVRLWVVGRSGNPRERVVGAFLRIGRTGSLIDNIDAGGFMSKIGLEEGKLGPGRERHDRSVRYERHPDSGTKVAGVILPFWHEAKLIACNTLSLFPNLNFAGIDIAIGEQGPVVIEMNVSPDPSGGIYFGFCRSDLVTPDPWEA